MINLRNEKEEIDNLDDKAFFDIANRKGLAVRTIKNICSECSSCTGWMVLSESLYKIKIEIRLSFWNYEQNEAIVKELTSLIVPALMFTRMSIECYPERNSLIARIKLI